MARVAAICWPRLTTLSCAAGAHDAGDVQILQTRALTESSPPRAREHRDLALTRLVRPLHARPGHGLPPAEAPRRPRAPSGLVRPGLVLDIDLEPPHAR